MNDLLELAIKAHGGLERWRRIRAIDLELSITGAIWYLKSKPDALRAIKMRVQTGQELVTTQFVGQSKRTRFEPNSVVVELDGVVVDSRADPEKSFEGQGLNTPWDDVHVAYFSGEAIWTYLNTPFIYARPDFITNEISPIKSDGEIWRRLRVTFPDSVKSHTKTQISCFGPDGLLRRHDYTVDILQGGTGLNYASDYHDIDGIIVPMKRRIFAYTGDYELVPEPLLVSIDIDTVAFRR